MKVLIVTPYGNFNYGNKFQNYAMQTILERYNCNVFTITNKYWYSNKKNECENWFTKMKVKIWNLIFGSKRVHREKNFRKFSNNYIKTAQYTSNMHFDKVCIGSDQIWNPYFSDKFYYTYAQFSDNAFSYAASFGIDKIPTEYREKLKEGLSNLKSISVREDEGAKIVENLIGQKVEVNVDPTMLLTEKDWDKIIEKPKYTTNKKYIFTYFLGDTDEDFVNYLEDFSKSTNFEIVDLGQSGKEKYYLASPSEFLYYLKNSECVFTDSFHGAVFSILYKKPFYVFDRKDSHTSMSSRLDTLLDKFGLQERKLNNYDFKTVLDIDFNHVDEILKMEREKADNYLKRALNIKENEIEN